MGFKEFLTERFYNQPAQLAKLNNSLEELRNLVSTKNFHDAGLLLQKWWMVLEPAFLDATKQNITQEINLLLPILKELHKINKTYKNIRNVATKEY